MADPSTTKIIEDIAAEPKVASGDQGSYENPELRDMIAVDKYLRQIQSTTAGKRGRRNRLRSMFMKLSPPGSRG